MEEAPNIWSRNRTFQKRMDDLDWSCHPRSFQGNRKNFSTLCILHYQSLHSISTKVQEKDTFTNRIQEDTVGRRDTASWRTHPFVTTNNPRWHFVLFKCLWDLQWFCFPVWLLSKDIQPAGIVDLKDCISVDMADNIRPLCFVLNGSGSFCVWPILSKFLNKERRFYFYADNEVDLEGWVSAIKKKTGIQLRRSNEVSHSHHRERESSFHIWRISWTNFTFQKDFLAKPVKEGILMKQKKRDQLKKSKPIRLVLTPNFLYYFPAVNVLHLPSWHVFWKIFTSVHGKVPHHSHLGPLCRTHSKQHVQDSKLLQVERLALWHFDTCCRIATLLHPLLLSTDDERELNSWVNALDKEKQYFENESKSSTEQEDVKTKEIIDYNIEVTGEQLKASNTGDLSSSKSFQLKVNAFWTSWTMEKTYEDILQLLGKLYQSFTDLIFPGPHSLVLLFSFCTPSNSESFVVQHSCFVFLSLIPNAEVPAEPLYNEGSSTVPERKKSV